MGTVSSAALGAENTRAGKEWLGSCLVPFGCAPRLHSRPINSLRVVRTSLQLALMEERYKSEAARNQVLRDEIAQLERTHREEVASFPLPLLPPRRSSFGRCRPYVLRGEGSPGQTCVCRIIRTLATASDSAR